LSLPSAAWTAKFSGFIHSRAGGDEAARYSRLLQEEFVAGLKRNLGSRIRDLGRRPRGEGSFVGELRMWHFERDAIPSGQSVSNAYGIASRSKCRFTSPTLFAFIGCEDVSEDLGANRFDSDLVRSCRELQGLSWVFCFVRKPHNLIAEKAGVAANIQYLPLEPLFR
jgi:hypothetical protein